MTTIEDIERAMAIPLPEDADDDIDAIEAALEESGLALEGFDPFDYSSDIYDNQNIPEAK